jgi:dethiobiotin synthetase
MVAGIGTEVGKTIVSTILTLMLGGEYWKPIECGEDSDTKRVSQWLGSHLVHKPAYSFSAPMSPHHAARLEGKTIDIHTIALPQTHSSLIIEGVGGVFVPLTTKIVTMELFKSWECQWVLVSKNYLGSINHTLLTIEALRRYHLPILGIIFNGEVNRDSEAAIVEISQLPYLGRLLPEATLDHVTFQKYAEQWRTHFSPLL